MRRSKGTGLDVAHNGVEVISGSFQAKVNKLEESSSFFPSGRVKITASTHSGGFAYITFETLDQTFKIGDTITVTVQR